MAQILSWNDLRAVVGLGLDYPDGTVVGAHAHDRAQILYGMSGVVTVSTERGAWMMTPDQGLWIPARTVHSVRMVGTVRMRSVYLLPDAVEDMPPDCVVLSLSTLFCSLISEITALPRPPAAASVLPRDSALVSLLLHELPRLEAVALNLPLPASPQLRALCENFLRRPLAHATIEAWCRDLGISRRSFTRRFRTETGLSLGEWRQRACVLAAMPRLLRGAPVTDVALGLGYENPAAFASMFRRLTGETPSRYAPD